LDDEKELTCGCLLFFEDKFLIVKPFGPSKTVYWSLPKGLLEEGETEQETMIRELFEETNIRITKDDVVFDLGINPYLKNKDIHLFVARIDSLPEKLKCNSFFEMNGKQVPEVVKFQWVTTKEAKQFLHPAILQLINKNNLGEK